ncbi:MAG: hypothetical protein AAF439_06600 [Pseudomonadota bacterium]
MRVLGAGVLIAASLFGGGFGHAQQDSTDIASCQIDILAACPDGDTAWVLQGSGFARPVLGDERSTRIRVRKGAEVRTLKFGGKWPTASISSPIEFRRGLPAKIRLLLCGRFPDLRIERATWTTNFQIRNYSSRAEGNFALADTNMNVRVFFALDTQADVWVGGDFRAADVPITIRRGGFSAVEKFEAVFGMVKWSWLGQRAFGDDFARPLPSGTE